MGSYSKEILKFDNTEVKAIDRDNSVKILAKKLEVEFPKDLNFSNKIQSTRSHF